MNVKLLIVAALVVAASARVEDLMECKPIVCPNEGIVLKPGEGLADGDLVVAIPGSSASVTLLGVNIAAGTIDGFLTAGGVRVEQIIISSSKEWSQNIYLYDESEEKENHLKIVTEDGSAIEKVDVCYHFHALVEHTAEACFEKRYEWALVVEPKQVGSIEIGATQTYYWEIVEKITVTEIIENFVVKGEVLVKNGDPVNELLIDRVDIHYNSEVFQAADCDGAAVPPLGEVVCHYEYAFALAPLSPPTSALAKVIVAGGMVMGDEDAAEFAWELCKETDRCVSLIARDGRVVARDVCEPRNVTDRIEFTPNCTHAVSANLTEGYILVNPATGEPLDSSDVVWLWVDIKCTTGCTLTQGYWMTHSQFGPSHFDERWYLIDPVKAAAAKFFLNTRNYYQVMIEPSSTAPAGYYQLAQQYIAAKLNVLSGASSTADVNSAITIAEKYFSGKQTLTYAQLISRATVLDKYNNGLTGPGHCDS